MIRRLICSLHGHPVDYFPRDDDNVHRIAYSCRCGNTFVSRARARRVLAELFQRV